MTRLLKYLFMLLLMLSGGYITGCEAQCDADQDTGVGEAVEETGDEIEEATD